MSRRRKRPLAQLAGDSGGAVALIFAIMGFLICGLVGGALDFAQVYRIQSKVQSGIDAGVLAAARVRQLGGTEAAAIEAGNATLAPIIAGLPTRGTINFAARDASSMKAIADLTIRTSFIAVIGLDTLSVRASSVATFGVGGASQSDVELVMMLDTTGSMRGQKIEDLKAAAKDLVEIVIAEDQSRATSKVGIAPYAEAVRLDPQMFREVTGRNAGGGSHCVVERTGAEAYTDAAPAPGSLLVAIDDVDPSLDCSSHRTVEPLTTNKGRLHGAIQSLSADGRTAGHLGTAWAWYMLSPKWSSIFNGESTPAPYSQLTELNAQGQPKLRKIAVLMTDGEYNTQYSGVSSTMQARALCVEMKKAGIDVFAVGFDLGDNATAIETLSGCASDASKFYNTTTGEQLRMAFRDIGLRAAPLRIEK